MSEKIKADNSIQLIGRIRNNACSFLMNELKKIGCYGIVPSHGDILITLFENEAMSMTEIADAIHRERSTVTTLISKLVKLGFVEIKKNSEDGRYNVVYLTDKGKNLKPCFYNISRKMYVIEYEGISDKQKQDFKDILKIIYNNFSKYER